MRRRLLLVLLVTVLSLAPAAAQDSGDVVTLTVEPRQEAAAVSVEGPASIEAVVSFESTNPLDDQQERTILMDLEGVPNGWTAAVEPAHFQVSNGDSETIVVTLSVSPDADASEVDLVLTARLLPRGASALPGIGSQVEPEETASAALRFVREDPLTREFVESFGAWLWFVLAAAVVLAVVSAKLVYDTRRTAVKLHARTTDAPVTAGGRVAVPLRVENVTRVEDTVVFHVAPMPDGWSAHLPVPELDLDGGQTEDLHLIIQAPKGVPAGTKESVGVSAHSAQAPKRAAELVITAIVEHHEEEEE